MKPGGQYSRLLDRQVRKHVPPELLPLLGPFLERVNASYQHYEQDRELLSRAMEISSHELRESNEQLQKSKESLETINYAAAHDLKNHALNIQSMLLLLNKYRHIDAVKEEQVLNYLDKSLAEFLGTVHGFLYVAKVQAQQEKDGMQIPFTQLKDSIEMECKHLVEKKKALLIWDWPDLDRNWPATFLKPVLMNLITNSIKYSLLNVAPVVTVRLQIDQGICILSVSDNGRGMDLKKNEKNLFGLFSRLNNTAGEEGTGVGLYLVKKLVEQRKGRLQVESSPGNGTTVIIETPLQDGTN